MKMIPAGIANRRELIAKLHEILGNFVYFIFQ